MPARIGGILRHLAGSGPSTRRTLARVYTAVMLPVSLDPDPVVEAYKRDVDRTLLRENLKLTPDERILKLQDFVCALHALREAGRQARQQS